LGAYRSLEKKIQIEHAQEFYNFVILSAVELQLLVNMTGLIVRKNVTLGKIIPVRECILIALPYSVTLRYICVGYYVQIFF
jgi:hypothetical protein